MCCIKDLGSYRVFIGQRLDTKPISARGSAKGRNSEYERCRFFLLPLFIHNGMLWHRASIRGASVMNVFGIVSLDGYLSRRMERGEVLRKCNGKCAMPWRYTIWPGRVKLDYAFPTATEGDRG